MRQLPEAVYAVHEALAAYVAVHNKVFKKGLLSIFKPIPFGEHAESLAAIADLLRSAELEMKAEEHTPEVFFDFTAALRNTVEQLRMICTNLHRETLDVGSYKYGTYNQDIAVYHAMESNYQTLGQQVNQLISSPPR